MYLLIKRYQKVFNKMYTVIISDRGRFRIIFFGRDHIYLYAYLHFYFLWWSSDTFYPRIIFTTFPALFFFQLAFLKISFIPVILQSMLHEPHCGDHSLTEISLSWFTCATSTFWNIFLYIWLYRVYYLKQSVVNSFLHWNDTTLIQWIISILKNMF